MPDPPAPSDAARRGLAPDRRRGQHFLFDRAITDRIAAAAGDLTDVVVYEVGPGLGGLTRSLLRAGARNVVAVEADARCVAVLRDLIRANPRRLKVHCADALAFDEAAHLPSGARIVANLPYGIATPLLLKWLRTPGRFASMTLMFQREVGLRLCAVPRSRAYGRLSVMAQWLCRVRRLFDVAPGSFNPAPAVRSSVMSLVPRSAPLAPAAFEDLERITAAAFGQRRKMLRSSLGAACADAERLLTTASVDPKARAEELTVPQFCALARALGGRQGATAAGVPG